MSEDAHDLHDWASKLEVVLNDSDETVGDECDRVNVIFVFYLPSATKSLGTPVYKGVLRWWQMGGRWQQRCTLTVLKPIVFCVFSERKRWFPSEKTVVSLRENNVNPYRKQSFSIFGRY